jgi:transposase-like protein
MVLVQLSVVEQRFDAVRAVLAGATATEVAASAGVSRQSVHTWIGRYLVDGLAGLADRSRRPASCPHQVSTVVEVHVAEMRREHPRWGAKRIRMELLRKPVETPVGGPFVRSGCDRVKPAVYGCSPGIRREVTVTSSSPSAAVSAKAASMLAFATSSETGV